MSRVLSIAGFDFHVHSSLSHDGKGSILEYCERAIALGMKAIGFCEHVDLDPRDPVFGLHDYERYRSEVEEAKGRFGERLMLRMGAEVGYVPRVHKEIAEFLEAHSYDYVVGSVHAIEDGCAGISEEYEALETFSRRELLDVYREYFETVRQMVVSGLFDVVGHLDLVNRFGCNYLREELHWGGFYGVLRRIFEGVLKREMTIEINTSGLRQSPGQTYPPREPLLLYRELGGRQVLLGSDAHSPEELSAGIPAGLSLARELGLDPFIIFTGRQAEPLSA